MKRVLRFFYNLIPFKKHLYITIKKLWSPQEKVFRHLHFKGIFTVHAEGIKPFNINHYGYQIENEIFWNGLAGGWEKNSLSIWIKLCKTASVVLDIGANTGIYSLVAKAANPGANVYAFEPVKRVYSKLVSNNMLNGYDIKCCELAVSNLDGQATIYDTAGEHILSVTLNKNFNSAGTMVIPTVVGTAKLSSFIEQNGIGKIDLIKLDVETHEPEVLEGMGPYLGIQKPAILIEILNDEIGRRVETLVQNMNYYYFNIDENEGIRRTDSILKSDYYNYLLCQQDTAVSLGLIS